MTKILTNIAMIAIDSSRTRIYLQRLFQINALPHKVFILNASHSKTAEQKSNDLGFGLNQDNKRMILDKYHLNMDLTVMELCQKYHIEFEIIESLDMNSEIVYQKLNKETAPYYIFSAKGILKTRILNLPTRFIHVHSGALPKFKGSTVPYYTLLNRNPLTTTALFLEKELDQGSIIASKTFITPKDLGLMDHFYDSYFRSETLVDIIKQYCQTQNFPNQSQEVSQGETYHIIHPVLKALAMRGKSIPFYEI